MSHRKHTKRGASLYLEKWNPAAKQYIHTCAVCGAKGYSPAVDEPDFEALHWENSVIAKELRRTLKPLPLDRLGRCGTCAAVMEQKHGTGQ
jgi:hypothetical protein